MTGAVILVVEDNEKNMKLVRDLLQFSGYVILEAHTAEQGIQLALESNPDLILMDIQLPGINGIEALNQLRIEPKTKSIPVIALTASAMTDDEKRIKEAGFDGYIRKPFDLDLFLEEVSGTLDTD